jgi:hypothetical protein
VEYNNITSDYLSLNCGVPQGSILGPLLFIIYVNDLPSAVNKFKMIIYADDTTLFTSMCSTNANEVSILNEDLTAVSEWLKLNKLSLNISKTKAMILHTPQRKFLYPDIYIDNIRISFVDEFNFLGIIIDKNMKFKAHLCHISKKISKAVGIMSKLKNLLPKSVMLHIYNALIQSHLNYGLILWGNQSKNIFKLQKKAIRIVNNVKYNAHSSALFKKDHILKFGDMCALHDFTFCYKFIHGILPKYFIHTMSRDVTQHEYLTRQVSNLRIPAVRHEFARNSMTYRYPTLINSMPLAIRNKIYSHSYQGFKLFVKHFFIDK